MLFYPLSYINIIKTIKTHNCMVHKNIYVKLIDHILFLKHRYLVKLVNSIIRIINIISYKLYPYF